MKKISLRLHKAFRHISLFSPTLFSPMFPQIFSHVRFRPPLFLQASSIIFPWHSFTHLSLSTLSSLPPFRVFQGKTHPAPSARPFGAMRRLELWY